MAPTHTTPEIGGYANANESYTVHRLADRCALAGNLAGWLVTLKKEGLGRWTNLGVGMVGALIGGLVFSVFGIAVGLREIKVTLQDLVSAFLGRSCDHHPRRCPFVPGQEAAVGLWASANDASDRERWP